MKRSLILTLLLIPLAAGALLCVFVLMARPAARRSVAYNHKKHIELGLDCASCHPGIAEGRARAGLPALAVCASCHGQEDDNPKTQAVRDHVSAGTPIPWKKIYNVPGHVYFSHRRHARLAGLDCAVCHGDMSKTERPVTRQAVKIGMERCMDCHRRMKATNDCLACHR